MLRELRTGDSASRRWFRGPDLDLMVRFGDDGEPSSFELGFMDGEEELLWRWQRDAGITLWRVDDGEDRPGRHKASPLLRPGRGDAGQSLAGRLVALGGELPGHLLEFVRSVLEGHQRA